jgi:malonyl-CoA/methylmalonyl-CoA synthetase
MFLPSIADPSDRPALVAGGRSLSYRELSAAASALAARLEGVGRVALWASPRLETCVGALGALLAGVPAVPINPRIGSSELHHVLVDSSPQAVIACEDEALPAPFAQLPRLVPDLQAPGRGLPPEPEDEAVAFLFYTSGTTGPPKGVLVPRRAVASNLDALAAVWRWTDRDVLTHGLPLFHVHGLVLGVLGPLRAGGTLRYAGRFSPEAIAAELRAGATMLFAVPTMYHALAEAAERDLTVRDALGAARLLVSGSAPLPVREFRRIEAATGRRIVERYGLTETLMNCATPDDAEPRPGSVGPPLPGVDLRLVDDEGGALDPDDSESIGEVLIRGPNLFLGYFNRPEATAEVVRGGWFSTGDLATRDAGGWVRIVGRRATDLIKTGGYKVGAGEVEAALLEHPAVMEAAVLGEPDDRLGERIVAWVVLRPDAAGSAASRPAAAELADHVATSLAPHKRPRDVRFVDALPRNEMGKVRKDALREPPSRSA